MSILRLKYILFFLYFCNLLAVESMDVPAAQSGFDRQARTCNIELPLKVKKCVNGFLGNFYYVFFRCDEADDVVSCMTSSIISNDGESNFEKAGFYEGKYGKSHLQLTSIATEYFLGAIQGGLIREHALEERTLDDIKVRTRFFYYLFVKAMVEQFFDNNMEMFINYLSQTVLLIAKEEMPLLGLFKLFDTYRDWEIILESVYECYESASEISDNELRISYFLLLLSGKKTIPIFQKLGNWDSILRSVTHANRCPISLSEVRKLVCFLSISGFDSKFLVSIRKVMGLSDKSKKGLYLLYRELELDIEGGIDDLKKSALCR